MPVEVLLVDDSAIIRGLMTKALSLHSDIAIVGCAFDGVQAIASARMLQPDIIILDIEMPVMDGITALPELLKVSPKSKIIIASNLSLRNAAISLQALALGATDYLAKPTAKSDNEVEEFYREMTSKILALGGHASLDKPLFAVPPSPTKTIVKMAPKPVYPHLAAGEALNPEGIHALAIASSTGGPQALTHLFSSLKGKLKNIPVFITQHMPPTFTTLLAEQITAAGERICTEGKQGEVVARGHTYIAPGDFHMVVAQNRQNEIIISLNKDPQENFCRPSANPMLRSLSAVYGRHLAVVVLTGMGHDGMEGARIVVKNGGSVIAQDEASSIVYGMPKAVVDNKLCKEVLPLKEIGKFLIQQIHGGA